MQTTKHKKSAHWKSTAFFTILIAIVIVSALGLAGYAAYRNQTSPHLSDYPNSSKLQNVSFDQNFNLQLGQTAILESGDEAIKFRFTTIEPAIDSDTKCYELCPGSQSTINTELEYAGKTFDGLAYGEMDSNIGMDYEANGAYPLVPYNIYLASVDFGNQIGTVKITQKKFTKVEFDEQFTLEDDGVAAIVPGKTGVHIRFGICGVDSPCIREIDFYVNDESVSVFSFGPTDPKITLKNGNLAEYGGVRLHIIESDYKTYARFVLEKI